MVPSNFYRLIKVFIVLFIYFTIIPIVKSQEVRFAVITDVHSGFLSDVDKRLKVFIDKAKEENVDFIIQLGDFTSYMNDEQSKSFMDIWNSFPGKRYHVVGNHDLDNSNKSEVKKYLGLNNTYYSFDINKIHFVVMDDNHIKKGDNYIDYEYGNYFKEDEKNTEYYGNKELQWFKNDLTKTDLPIVIFSHAGFLARDHSKVETIIKNYNDSLKQGGVILSMNGHGHSDVLKFLNKTPYLEVPTASHTWTGERAEPFTTVRFIITSINTNEGKIKIKGYSKDVDYQKDLPSHYGKITSYREFSYIPYRLCADFTYKINDKTMVFENKSCGEAKDYHWYFGDGEQSVEKNPTHTYERKGKYSVKLIINNTDSRSIKIDTLNIN